MSELTQTYLSRLVTDYGAAAARAARAPRNTSAARSAFEVENAACASLLAAIGALVAERDRLLHEHHQVRADAQARVDAAVVRALASEKALKEERAAAQLVKEFAFEHRLFGDVVVYTESSPPPWVLPAEKRWFWTQHVLTLAVGQSTETEWHKIRRIK